jgi:hypothetical protein
VLQNVLKVFRCQGNHAISINPRSTRQLLKSQPHAPIAHFRGTVQRFFHVVSCLLVQCNP